MHTHIHINIYIQVIKEARSVDIKTKLDSHLLWTLRVFI